MVSTGSLLASSTGPRRGTRRPHWTSLVLGRFSLSVASIPGPTYGVIEALTSNVAAAWFLSRYCPLTRNRPPELPGDDRRATGQIMDRSRRFVASRSEFTSSADPWRVTHFDHQGPRP